MVVQYIPSERAKSLTKLNKCTLRTVRRIVPEKPVRMPVLGMNLNTLIQETTKLS